MIVKNSIPFIDLRAQQKKIYPRILEKIQGVLAHGQYILGPEIRELEERLAAYVGVRHAITCSSGTDALLMILLAKGVCPGDAIFTTPFTFIATAEVVQLLGATPVFVDIDPRTYNVNPEALKNALVNFGKSPATADLEPRGIIAVDLFGQPADYNRINALAQTGGCLFWRMQLSPLGLFIRAAGRGLWRRSAATSFSRPNPWAVMVTAEPCSLMMTHWLPFCNLSATTAREPTGMIMCG